jgi:hypothetical protein
LVAPVPPIRLDQVGREDLAGVEGDDGDLLLIDDGQDPPTGEHAGYYNYHKLHGELDWQTPAERFDGTPFTDRGFGSVPALAGVADLLDAILAA